MSKGGVGLIDPLRIYDVPVYVMSWVFGSVFLGFAAWFDQRSRQVPALIWVITLPYVIPALAARSWVLDAMFIGPTVAWLLYARRRGWTGLADVKAVAWTSALVGVLPSLLVYVFATAATMIGYRVGTNVEDRVAFLSWYYPAYLTLGFGVILWLILTL